jgi:hypothetical protein
MKSILRSTFSTSSPGYNPPNELGNASSATRVGGLAMAVAAHPRCNRALEAQGKLDSAIEASIAERSQCWGFDATVASGQNKTCTPRNNVGLWRSWERASMAWKRSSVRSRSGPPNHSYPLNT